jgi:prevent-host-death family protein
MKISDARKNLREAVDRARSEPVIVERNGKPIAVLLSPERYEQLMDALDEIEDVAALDQAMVEYRDDLELLAKRFEEYEPRPEDQRDPQLYRDLEAAVRARSEAERAVAKAVAAMRADGDTWQTVGRLLGTTGQAAQQRYGKARAS